MKSHQNAAGVEVSCLNPTEVEGFELNLRGGLTVTSKPEPVQVTKRCTTSALWLASHHVSNYSHFLIVTTLNLNDAATFYF